MGLAQRIDEALHRTFGLAYLCVARERSIHERCDYARAAFAALGLDRPRVLDVGCGGGILLRHLARAPIAAASYTGLDWRATRLDSRYRDVRLPHRFLDIDLDSDWQVEGDDAAWCSEVLEHLIDDAGVLRKIARSVVPGAPILVTMPSLPFLTRLAAKMPDMLNVSPTQDGWHVRAGYTRESMAALAAAAGLTVRRIDAISPRRDFEVDSRTHAMPVLREAVDRIKFDPAPVFVFDADDRTLAHYWSIAAVLRRP